MRKNTIRKGFIAAILTLIIFTLTSCGNSIVGSWTMSTFGIATTLRFDSNGTLSVSALGLEVVAGSYKVSGNQITISAGESLYGTGLSSGVSTFSISGDQLILDGLVFTRN